MVVALPQAIKQGLCEGQSESVISILFERHLMQLPPGIAHFQVELLLHTEIAVVDEISWANAIDAQKLVAGFETKLLSDGSRLHGIHHRWLGLTGDTVGIECRHRDAGRGLIPQSGDGRFSSVCAGCEPPGQ